MAAPASNQRHRGATHGDGCNTGMGRPRLSNIARGRQRRSREGLRRVISLPYYVLQVDV